MNSLPFTLTEYQNRKNESHYNEIKEIWLSLVNQIFSNNLTHINYVQTLYGYAMSGLAYAEKVIVNIGQDYYKKQIFTKAICAAIGDLVIFKPSTFLKQSGANDKSTYTLENKHIILIDDCFSPNFGRIKSLCGGSAISVGGKGSYQTRKFDNKTTIVINSDKIPDFKLRWEDINSYNRRMVFIPFHYKKTIQNPDISFNDAFRDGIGNLVVFEWLLEGLTKHLDNPKFINCENPF
jgi:hypothetical protein